MAQVSAYHEAPYQGVSQAPPQVRRRDQAEALEDCLTAMPNGLQKRPPFQYLGVLAGHPGATDGIVHRVERPEGDCILTLTKEAGVAVPRLYLLSSLAAQAITVSAPAQTYLNTALTTPQADIGSQTLVDFTFLWNRNVVTTNSVAVAPTRNPEGMIWVRAANYSRTYKVSITPSGGGTTTVTLHTPNGSAVADADWVDTDVIAASMVSGAYTAIDGASIVGNIGAALGVNFTVTRIGPVISIVNTAGVDFTIVVSDGQGGAALQAVKNAVQKFSDLPVKAPDGFTVKVAQSSGSSSDDFFVKFVLTAGSGTGIWQECIEPGSALGLDPNTMPVGLFNDGAWKLEIMAWTQRTAGNADLVRDPDFIGQAIQDVCFWRGRLGLLAGEGVTLSSSDDAFTLYPRTTAAVLDSDPIARVNPAPGKTVFRYALPFESRLLLCGETLQCEVTSDGLLTPGRASIDIFARTVLDKTIRPVGVNGKLYFTASKGITASAVWEMKVDKVTDVANGDDLSTAAFKYVPAGVDRSATSEVTYTTLYALSGSSQLYVHLYRHADQERIQNCFERWNLPTGYTLGGAFFINTTLYVVACAAGAAHLLKLDLSPGLLDPDAASTIKTYLDLRASEAQAPGVYSAITDRTTITLPYLRDDGTALVVRAPGLGDLGEGFVPEVDLPASVLAGTNKLVVVGDLSATPYFVGHKYASIYDLSTIYALDPANKPLRNGRTQLRKLILDLANTGYLRAEVRAGGRDVQVTEFFGILADTPGSGTDLAPNATIRWPFPVQAENEQCRIRLVNDSPFGSTLLGYEWTAEFNPRSRRA